MMRMMMIALTLVGCSSPDPAPMPDASSDFGSRVDAATDAGGTALCEDSLYGRPNENTGLTGAECGPSCSCGEPFEAREFTDAELDAWLGWETPAVDELTADPYDSEPRQPVEGEVCALKFEGTTYTMTTYADRAAAEADGAVLTHGGACGKCSTLEDLVAYVRNPDLTEPVRQCGIAGIRDGDEAALECVEALGFTTACAQIWAYNATHTRLNCLEPCILALRDPYHLPDGGLNDCLACDEEQSGPVFKAVAGRTRRNSGLASAICRPCETVARVPHTYPTP